MKRLLFLLLVFVVGTSQAQTTWMVDSLNDSGFGSLRAAADSCSSGDTIRFNPNLIANGSDSIVLTSGEIDFGSKGLVVKGLISTVDTLFLSGNQSNRVFSFNGAGKILLDSLVLTNGNGVGAGVITNGGAVINYNGLDTLFVKNSKIYGNSATYGGAIMSTTPVSIFNSLIKNNFTSNGGGGGLYSAYLVIENSSVVENTAFEGIGGGISSITVKLINSNVSKNRASQGLSTALAGRGAGIYGDTVEVINSMITENSATHPISSGSSAGGGIYSNDYGSLIRITNSILSDNSATVGGGIYSRSSINFSSVIIDSSMISQNIAEIAGGGIYSLSSYSSSISISNSTISENKAISGDGGGVYCESVGSSLISNGSTVGLTFYNSTVHNNEAEDGGGVFCRTISSTLKNFISVDFKYSTLSNNVSKNFHLGGGMYVYSSSGVDSAGISVSLESSTITGNNSLSNGGGIWAKSASNTGSTNAIASTAIFVDNSTIYNNAGVQGAAIYTDATSSGVGASPIVVSSSIIAENGFGSHGISNLDTTLNEVISNGYNIFSGIPSGTVVSDSVGISASQLNLLPLASNGGATLTRMPGLGSIAIDNGDPNDSTDAQNVPIVGVRDVGASEYCAVSHVYDTIVSCDSYTWVNGLVYTSDDTSALYTLVNSEGCDSVIHLKLEIFHSSSSVDSITTCHSYTWLDGNTYYLSNNTAQYIVPNSVGCDSVVSLNLTITNTVLETYEACQSFTWRNGVTYTQSNNSARDTVINSVGCDTIFILDLIIQDDYTTDIISACDSLTWINGVTYYSNITSVFDTLTNSYGCDSIVELDLTINHLQTSIDSVSACLFYQWIDGQVYLFDNNTATHTLTGVHGCDSVVTLNLDLNYGTTGTDTHVVCDSLVWMDGNTYYSSSSSAYHTIIGGNSHGCDSVITLDLTVLGHRMVDDIISCEPYTWINGITYASSISGPSVTYLNSNGCDSTITLNLLVASPTVNVDTVMACESYTWVNGVTYYANTDTPIDTLVSIYGCDSVVYLDLTILHSTSYTQKVSACSSFTWVNGVTYDQSISGPTHILTNSMGCDSLITLDFCLVDVNTSVVQNGVVLHAQADSGASFQWMVCGAGVLNGANNAIYTVLSNGSYQVEVTQDGCVDTSDCITVNNVGIGEVNLSNNINIYPNPVHGQVNIEITNWPTNGAVIVVRDITGKQVYTEEVEPISNEETVQINTTKWVKGTYFIEVGEGDNRVVEKIVVQ